MFSFKIYHKIALKSIRHARFFRISNRMCSERVNYFDVFSLPVDYDLSAERLTPKYRELLKKSHPDKFHQKSEEEKEHRYEIWFVFRPYFHASMWPINQSTAHRLRQSINQSIAINQSINQSSNRHQSINQSINRLMLYDWISWSEI